ncbi:Pollen Ole e 1 allergen/extensin [Quillaja saponaria]|uniref:Pollen Ole e 1 allergen/extensin n=1 Tax=Quillaja saponaria TaxID=32244 RepID=A0AAD7VDN9_QUISA|nr:Pollen Ole e 1 allergen/extensin [Quillaja saponaria]
MQKLLSSFQRLAMNPISLLVILPLLMKSQFLKVEPAKPNSQITVMGFVYCDICSNNSFSKHSYFISGAEVRIDCTFQAVSAKSSEHIALSVNRTTNKYGVYKLEIPSVDGIKCAEDSELVSSCQASLMRSSSSSCDVPGQRTTSDEITIKSRQANMCIYSLSALNYRPSRRDITLCGR